MGETPPQHPPLSPHVNFRCTPQPRKISGVGTRGKPPLACPVPQQQRKALSLSRGGFAGWEVQRREDQARITRRCHRVAKPYLFQLVSAPSGRVRILLRPLSDGFRIKSRRRRERHSLKRQRLVGHVAAGGGLGSAVHPPWGSCSCLQVQKPDGYLRPDRQNWAHRGLRVSIARAYQWKLILGTPD